MPKYKNTGGNPYANRNLNAKRGRKPKQAAPVEPVQTTEQIVRLPLSELHPFPDHPYGIREDQAMQDTVDSVKQNGVVVPAIVRPRAEGGYEIVAGHRRKLASEQAGFGGEFMTNEEMLTALYEKFSAEQDNYRAWFLKQTPEEIIQHSYEYAVRQDILTVMEEAELPAAQASALLWKGTTLSDIYKDFTKVETGYMDILRDTVENRADEILKEAEALRSAPVYPYPRDYAVENDELDKYRLSRKANIACKEAIEQAIGDHYANNSLDTAAAVKQVVDAFGYDRTMYVLAVTVKHKDWDGRISDSNKQWAASMPVFEDRIDGSADQNVFFVVDKAHPGLTDLFVREARKAQAREKEKAQQKTAPKKEAEKPSILERLKKPVQKNAPNNSAHLPEQEL